LSTGLAAVLAAVAALAVLVPTVRFFRPDASPSRGSPCERLALSPVAGVSRWLLPLLPLLPLLSRLLSAATGRHRLVWLSDPVYHGLTRCVETGRLADP
jgi:hypothetical protein